MRARYVDMSCIPRSMTFCMRKYVNVLVWSSSRVLVDRCKQKTTLKVSKYAMATLVDEAPVPVHAHSRDDSENEAREKTHGATELEGVVDVTELCRQVAAMLGPNEMIHDADFNLYGAMSALELMDAKMDKAPPALQVRAGCCL